MSSAKRIISGSAASWINILVTLVFQIALVPVFLKYWTVNTYGAWILISSVINILTTLDRGHIDYLTYEFLRTDNRKKRFLSKLLWSGILMNTILCITELLVIGVLVKSNLVDALFGEYRHVSWQLLRQAKLSLVIQMLLWSVFNSNVALLYRFLFNYGYFPRYIWLNIISTCINILVSIVAVMMGCDLLQTVIYSSVAVALFSLFQLANIFLLLRKVKVALTAANLKLGFRNFITSLFFSLNTFLETFRQQGVRLVITPFVGTSGLAAFSTMRTGANIALQGLSTISNPLLPELMRFMKQKEQEKIDASLGLVWFILTALLAPGIVLLQYAAPGLFHLWTKGQITFNPLLFAFLSMGVLVYAIAQPGMTVIKGNNLLKIQIVVGFLSTATLMGSLLLLMPFLNILGVGIALFLAEVVAAIGYFKNAKKWMIANHLTFPDYLHQICIVSLLITAFSCVGFVYFDNAKLYVLAIAELFLFINMIRFWNKMPSVAIQKISFFIKRYKLTY
ncbi:lipopolysaccharide biosynthesis protein [Chitinophaga sp. 30R24]|uniref:lipopolysaccharide biosynthesis protein n=1 Tax=Chitinophaga sp. 30R24 TaxID=3248838 RepID=UPI003B8EBE66